MVAPTPTDQQKQIQQMREDGLTVSQMADRLDKGRSTVGLAMTKMRRAGIEVPPPASSPSLVRSLPLTPHQASAALYRAVKQGAIRRPERCERCLVAGPVQGHHTDYSRPLYVEWLCDICHRSEHRTEAAT